MLTKSTIFYSRFPETFYLAKLKLYTYWAIILLFPLLQSLETAILIFVSKSLTTLDTSNKWKHGIICLCDWHISLRTVSSSFIQVVAYKRISLFLRLNNVIGSIYHILFFHSSISTYLYHFYLLFWLLWIMLQWTWV